jgi:hypothetical protein
VKARTDEKNHVIYIYQWTGNALDGVRDGVRNDPF